MKFILDFENAEIIGDLNTRVRVCVLVNTFNHEKYIEKCLTSIIEQKTDFQFKIIVHDDNSTDGTKRILIEFQRKYPNTVLLILEKENQWQIGNSNLAMLLTWIDSDFIALCEGDDYWNSDNKLSYQEGILASDPSISISHHSVEIENEVPDGTYAKRLLESLGADRSVSPELKLGLGNFIMTCSVFFRNRVIEKSFLAGIHSLLPVDWLIFAALAEKGKIHFFKEKMATYRIHANSVWSSELEDVRLVRNTQTHWYLAGGLKGEVGAQARNALTNQITSQNFLLLRYLRKKLIK